MDSMSRLIPLFWAIVFLLFYPVPGISADWPFPRNATYPFGLKPNHLSQEDLNREVQRYFSLWREGFLSSEGTPPKAWRIRRDAEYRYDTVSEGIGYGMLILVLMENPTNDTRRQFDGLWRYHQRHRNPRGLMHWRIDRTGRVLGENSATDAEEDIAMALLMAHKQWGSTGDVPYLEEARGLIDRIMLHEVDREGGYILKPGDVWGGAEITNPSFFAPAYWRLFLAATGDRRWAKVLDANYDVVARILSRSSTGLSPDWCDADGRPARGRFSHAYRYDAVRVPWRIGLDLLWNGPNTAPSGNRLVHQLTRWISETTGASAARIVDGYTLSGRPIGKWNDPTFIGSFAISAQASGTQGWLNHTYDRLLEQLEDPGHQRYYQMSLGVLYLITLSGNWPNPFPEPTSFRARGAR